MKTLFKTLSFLVVGILLNNINLAQNIDIINTSFEDYQSGNIAGQNKWQVVSGSGIIVDDSSIAKDGNKALNLIASNQKLVVKNIAFSGSEKGVGGVVYVDLFIKINSMEVKDFAINGYDLFGGSNKRSFVLEFDTPSGQSGDFRIYDGSTKVPMGKYNLGEWNRVSAKIDYDNSIYQVIFNGSDVFQVNFRENYTPTASGGRQAGIKEFHELRLNLGYDGATGSVNAIVDDIYIGQNPIEDVEFPGATITHKLEVIQPSVGEILVDPVLDEYPDSTEVTVTLDLPYGYKNYGWTGDLSGTDSVKHFYITSDMTIGADVRIDENNPPPQYRVVVIQPDTGHITLEPADSLYYDYTKVTASIEIPPGYKFEGWTGDLSGVDPTIEFVVHNDMTIGASVVYDDTPPTIYSVSTAEELKSVCKNDNLKPGDIVEVEDGYYDTGGGITVESSGTELKPIIIRAKNIGGAELGGETYFTLRKTAFIEISGFHFTSNKYTVIKLEACNNIRITNNIFELTEEEGKSGKWVYVGGYWNDGSLLSHHNRIDHNIFRHKHQLGNFITIDGGDVVSQHDRIDHNYFYDIGPRHENEMEAIRVGWSELSLTDGFTVIEYNLFEECDGDPEIVSIKSCKDTVRYNTFVRCQGTLSLRHGNGSVINGNYFLGFGKEGSGGIRIYAKDHKIYNNYFEGLMGSKWDAAITLTNGDTESGSLSAHWQINNVIISNNSLINNFSNIEIGYAKSDNSWKKEPKNVRMVNNLVYGGANNPVKIITEPTNFVWKNNIMFPDSGVEIGMTYTDDQIRVIDPLLEYKDSLWELSEFSPAINASDNSFLFISDDMHGQKRIGAYDVGADEFSTDPKIRMPLTIKDVGPASDSLTFAELSIENPKSFELFQNYPNPFNPETVIRYSNAYPGMVNLTVYNVLGERVAVLVNRYEKSGTHSIVFNAANLSSGVYFYRITINNESKIKKMLLIK